MLIEAIWGKPRIMEVYLNIAEMGPGIYGVEAAAQHYFKTSAARLSQRQAARIAAILPQPIKRNAAAAGALRQALCPADRAFGALYRERGHRQLPAVTVGALMPGNREAAAEASFQTSVSQQSGRQRSGACHRESADLVV